MGITVGLNLEYSRHHNMSFDDAVQFAADVGYRWVEPMVHTGRQLLSEGGFMHSRSLLEDALEMKEVCDRNGVGISALSSHSQLVKPDVAVDYLRAGIRAAAEIGVKIVNTSEGFKRTWTTREDDFVLIRYSLTVALEDARRRGVTVALEPHHQYSASIAGMTELLGLVDSPFLGVNFDAGNVYLAGQSDVYEYLAAFLPRLVHVHAKDIGVSHGERDRGRVTGAAVGCACGDGVIDWRRLVEACADHHNDIVFSVECATREEAERSFVFLTEVIDTLSE